MANFANKMRFIFMTDGILGNIMRGNIADRLVMARRRVLPIGTSSTFNFFQRFFLWQNNFHFRYARSCWRSLLCFFSVMAVSLAPVLLYGQTTGELRIQKADLEAQITQLQAQIEDENARLDRFRQQKKIQLEQKQKEEKALLSEIAMRQREVLKERRAIAATQLAKVQVENNATKLLALIKQKAEVWQGEIAKLPFDVQKREGVISTLVFDIDGGRITATEAVNRFLTFLDNEVAMSYDSQVINTVLEVQGENQTGTLLRVGRVYLAFLTEADVWEFGLKEGSFVLPAEPANLGRERKVRAMVDMVEGKRPPDFQSIAIDPALLERP